MKQKLTNVMYHNKIHVRLVKNIHVRLVKNIINNTSPALR